MVRQRGIASGVGFCVRITWYGPGGPDVQFIRRQPDGYRRKPFVYKPECMSYDEAHVEVARWSAGAGVGPGLDIRVLSINEYLNPPKKPSFWRWAWRMLFS